MSGWSLRLPEALAALLLLAWLWWRLRLAAPARVEWTGALAIWQRIGARAQASGARTRERRALPWPTRAALCALGLGIVALAGPVKRSSAPEAPGWRLVLDRTPAMFLPIDSSAGAPTRVVAAVESALRLCEQNGVPAQAREWITHVSEGPRTSRSARPPAEWLTPAWGSPVAPPWHGLDAPATLWLSDCAPQPEPRFAGLALSGAAPIPGPIADLGEQCWFFDGEGLSRAAWGADRAGLHLGEGVPGDIATLAGLWARMRALPIVAAGQAACLTLQPGRGAGPLREGRLSRASWAVPASAAALPADPSQREWASFDSLAGERFCAVSWRPGQVRLGVQRLDAGAADPATLALDWVELFESACLSEPSLVSLAQRQRRAAPRSSPPQPQTDLGAQPRAYAAWLAGLASALALASVLLGQGAFPREFLATLRRPRAARPSSLG